MYYIGTVRFSNETFQENKKWREENDWDGCIYGSPTPIAQSPYWRKVGMGAEIFILEMNNDEDRIEGIGLIKNFPLHKSHIYYQPFQLVESHVHDDQRLNLYFRH